MKTAPARLPTNKPDGLPENHEAYKVVDSIRHRIRRDGAYRHRIDVAFRGLEFGAGRLVNGIGERGVLRCGRGKAFPREGKLEAPCSICASVKTLKENTCLPIPSY